LQIKGQTPAAWARFIDEAHLADSTIYPSDSKGENVIQITTDRINGKGKVQDFAE
jgi:hypothetical protein